MITNRHDATSAVSQQLCPDVREGLSSDACPCHWRTAEELVDGLELDKVYEYIGSVSIQRDQLEKRVADLMELLGMVANGDDIDVLPLSSDLLDAINHELRTGV